ncbi:MAG: DTW domain-containing protein [Deltaproteobacteria bacterium]|nr:MAG: DTW domain-containing protein [Deltaproteobacteria bacterium]
MGRRSKSHPRCPQCRLHVERCMCDAFRPMATNTRLLLLLHQREWKKNTNTGRIALHALENATHVLRGLPGEPLDLAELRDPTRRVLLLFPREDAVVLTPEVMASDPRPVTLVVPDGNWSQARRVVRREEALVQAEAIVPPPGAATRYRLRDETTDEGMATAEAVARVLGVLEGPAVQDEIERLFDLFVTRTLATRGVAT